ncbi:hypothetical protein QQ045_001798 [Rhodiola kirilowii]
MGTSSIWSVGFYLSLFVLLIALSNLREVTGKELNETLEFQVGVVLDFESQVGLVAEACMSIALSDFHSANPEHKTRLRLHKRASKDVVGAASQVLDLMQNKEVIAIIGPQRSTEATFVIELGRKAQVPILSFSATTLSISPTHNPYFIRTGQNNSYQVKAITSLIKGFYWHEVVIIYENTPYGNGLVPYLTDSFHEANIRVPYKSALKEHATDSSIRIELGKMKTLQTRVFLVHMTASLGSRLFAFAHEAEMMCKGYAWIITDGLSNSLNDMHPDGIRSVEGVIGLRPYVPRSDNLDLLKTRLKRQIKVSELNIFGLWAYDTAWALAKAVEAIGHQVQARFTKSNDTRSGSEGIQILGVSQTGPKLLNKILQTKFNGLSGEFSLVNGHLKPAPFEIFNILGNGERTIGYWTTENGITRELQKAVGLHAYSDSVADLRKIIWPGDSTDKPLGKTMRIGVPFKKGFTEFVNRTLNATTGGFQYEGFCIDIFNAAMSLMPEPYQFNYSFESYDIKKDTTDDYDVMLQQIRNKTYDAVVGDTTIVASRWYVDFTLPYSDSGVSMVVPVKRSQDIWIFVRPFSWDLWLTILAASVVTGLMISFFEFRAYTNQSRRMGRRKQIDMVLWLPLSSLYFAQRDSVVDGRSRFVLVAWYMLMMIILQSYSACLSSILTVQNLNPFVANVNSYSVGYQEGSFVKDFLIQTLHFDESKLRPYKTMQEYHEALTNGSRHDGIAAFFDETPYIKLFLSKYCSKYKIVGPSYKTDGFGFAFPVGSPFVSQLSKAILNVTQGPQMNVIENKYFGNYKECQNAAALQSENYGLKAYSFGGLLIVTFGGVLVVALSMLFAEKVAESYLWGLLIYKVKHFGRNSSNSQTSIHPAPPQLQMISQTDQTPRPSSAVSDDGNTVDAEEQEAYAAQGVIHPAQHGN